MIVIDPYDGRVIDALTEIVSQIQPSESDFGKIQVSAKSDEVNRAWENLKKRLGSRPPDFHLVMPRMLHMIEMIQDKENCDHLTQEWISLLTDYSIVHFHCNYPPNPQNSDAISRAMEQVPNSAIQFHDAMNILDESLELGLEFCLTAGQRS